MSLGALVESLRSARLQHRTGVVLLPPQHLGREVDLAARLDIDAVDLRTWVLERLQPDQRWLDLTLHRLAWEYLRAIAAEPRPGGCVLVANADLFLAGLHTEQRRECWRYLFGALRPERGLILVLPDGAEHLFPANERRVWDEADRLAVLGSEAQ
jgi:hypothetical protein